MKWRIHIPRRLFQISIRTLLLLVLVLCVWLASWTARARKQAEVVPKLEAAGCQIVYRHELDAVGKRIPNVPLPGPKWLRNIFGDHAFLRPYRVYAPELREVDLSLIDQLTSLEELQLECPLTDAGLAELVDLTNLKSLEIRSWQITDSGMSSLGRLRHLEKVELQGCRVTDAGLKPLAELTHLKSLSLFPQLISSDGAAWLKQRLPNLQMPQRQFPSQPEEQELVRQLRKIGAGFDADKDGWVAYLYLYGHSVTDDALLLAEQLNHLQQLELRRTHVSPSAISRLLEKNPTLKILPLVYPIIYPTNTPDDEAAVVAIAGLLSGPIWDSAGKLQGLDIRDEQVTDDDLAAIAKYRQIERFFIRYAPLVTTAGFMHLGEMSNLNAIYIYDTTIPIAAFKKLVEVKHLQEIDLTIPELKDDDLAPIADLKTLKRLILHDTKIQGPGFANLSDLPKLEILNISGPRSALHSDGLKFLSNLQQVRYLTLDDLSIEDAGLIHLADMSSLRSLSLRNTNITDAGLVHLQKLQNLKSLWLKNTKVTQAGIDELQKQLPQCKITAAQ